MDLTRKIKVIKLTHHENTMRQTHLEHAVMNVKVMYTICTLW